MVLQTSGTITHRNIANEFLVPQNQVRGLSNSFSFSSDTYIPSTPVIPAKGQFRSESYYYGKQNAPEWAIGSSYNSATGSTTLQSVVCDSGNNVFVGGYFTGILTLINFDGTRSNVYVAAGTQDAFVAKYSPAPTSNVLWAARMTSPGNDAVLSVSSDPGGNVFATGYYTGIMNIYSSSNTYVSNLAQYGGQDAFLVKYGPSGELRWGARIVSSGTDLGNGVATDASGNVYVTGYYNGPLYLGYNSTFTSPDSAAFIYPPGPQTGTTTTFPDGNYTVTSSTQFANEDNWRAFNKSDVSAGWTTSAAQYAAVTGNYFGAVSTVINGSSYAGEWLQIQMPQSIVLNSYFMTSYALRNPMTFKIAGSTNGSTWTEIDSRVLTTVPTNNLTPPANSNSLASYNYFRLCVNRVLGTNQPTDQYCSVLELYLYSNTGTIYPFLRQYGGQDIFLAKYDPNGNVIWGALSGSPGTDAANSVSTDLSGNVYVTGYYTGLLSILNSNTAIQRNVSNVSAFLNPPIPMTTGTTTSALPLGSYIASASTNAPGEDPWRAFDKSNVSNGWTTSTASYAATTGTYTGATSTTINGSGYLGEWLQLQVPTISTATGALAVTSYYLTSFQSSNVQQAQDVRTPKSWKLAGSTNGSTWSELDSQTSVPTGSIITLPVNSNTANSYNYFRLVVNQIKGAATTQYCSIIELYLYSNIGYSYPYLRQFGGQDVFLSKYDPNGNALWGVTMGSTGTDTGNSVSAESSGNVYVTGSYNGIMSLMGTNNDVQYSTSNTAFMNPPFPMSSATTVSIIPYGSYIASASNFFAGNDPYRAFNYYDPASGWVSSTASYAATTGAYNGVLSTTINGSAYLGEWLQIQMPTQVSLIAYKIVNTDTVPTRNPKTWKLAGSNNGSTWIEIDSKTNSAPISGAIITPAPTSNSLASYFYFRIVSNAVVGTSTTSYVAITELSLYSNVGYMYPTLNQTQAFTSGQDAFLAKYDPNGNILWGARAVSAGTDSGNGVATDSTGNVYMTGNYTGALYLIGNTYVSSSNVSAFVYPPYVMTAATTTFPEGSYVTSASTNLANEDPFRAFNKSNIIPGWTTSTASYAANTGNYSGVVSTTINGSAYLGEWLQIQMPQQIVLNSYYFTSNQASNVSQTSDVRTPKSWKIAGSVDATTWVELDSQTSAPTGLITVPSNSNTNVGYSYFRMAVNQIKGALTTQFCSIVELYLYSNTGWTSNTLPQISGQDVFVAKYDPSGNVLWGANSGSTGTDVINGMALNSQGNVYVTGTISTNVPMTTYASNGVSIPNTIGPTGSTQYGFIENLNPSGNVIGTTTIGTLPVSSYNVTSVCYDTTGNIYATGGYTGYLQLYNSDGTLTSTGFTSNAVQTTFLSKYTSNGNVIWSATLRSTGISVGNSVSSDASGNVFVTGNYTGLMKLYNSTGTLFANTLTQYGGQDVFIAKYGPSGEVLWGARAGSPGADSGNSVATDATGNVYVTGYYTGIMNLYSSSNVYVSNLAQYGGQDVFIVKYGPSGEVQWGARTGSPGTDAGTSLATDVAGNVFVTGYYTGLMNLYSSSNTYVSNLAQYGGQDVFIVKYDTNGQVRWGARTGSPGTDAGTSLATDVAGNVYVTGYYAGLMNIYSSSNVYVSNLSQYGGQDVFLIKYGPSGEFRWGARTGSPGTDAGNGVAVDVTGNVYVSGYYAGLMNIYSSSNVYVSNLAQIGGQDVFVAQYDPNGNVLGAARAGSSGTDTSTSIACDPTRFNTVCFGGTMGAASTFYKPLVNTIVKNYTTLSTGYTSLLTFPANPTPYWSLGLKTSGITDTETITSSTVDTSGNVFVAGYFTGSSIGFFPNVYVSYNSDGTVTSNTYNQTPVYQNGFLTKYNQTGTVLWSATLESATGSSAVNGISADSAGNVFVTGYYTGLMNLYSSSKTYVSNLAPYGGQDVFIVKYGPSGEVQWGARAGSSGTDSGTSVSTDQSGNVYITGFYTGNFNVYSALPTTFVSSNTSAYVYPSTPMTSNNSVLLDGLYIAVSSTFYSPTEATWSAFDKNTGTVWTTSGQVYNASTGVYGGAFSTVIDGSSYAGEWLQIQMPRKIVLTAYQIPTTGGREPKVYKIAGSNDGSTWVSIVTQTSRQLGVVVTGSSTEYSYFRLCVNQIQGATSFGFCSIAELYLYSNVITTQASNLLPQYSGQDIFISKYDPNGNVLWSANAGSPGTDAANAVSVDSSGNVYMTGYYTGLLSILNSNTYTNTSIQSNVSNVSAFLIPPMPMTTGTTTSALPLGSYIASASTNAPSEDPWKAFDKSNVSNGWTTSTASYAATTGTYSGATSTTINGSGYLGEWLQLQIPVVSPVTSYYLTSFQSSNVSQAQDVRTPKSWKLAGSTNGTTWIELDSQTSVPTGIITLPSSSNTANSYNYFRIVVNQIKGAATAQYCSITELYLYSNIGYSYPYLAQYGGQDAFLIKYDPNGKALWGACMGSAGTDAGTSAATDGSGNVYVTGYYTGLMNIYNSSNVYVSNLAQLGGQDAFLVKYGPSGEVRWGARMGSSGADAANSVITEADGYGNVFVSGYYTGEMNFFSSSNVASIKQVQGNLGGTSYTAGGINRSCGGGGGGAGTVGGNGSAGFGGNGGNGLQYAISGTPTYYGGGGGGGVYNGAFGTPAGDVGGAGGLGGGGAGNTGNPVGGSNYNGVPGTNGLGGGGGGAGSANIASPGAPSGKGGSGTVIISYTTGTLSATGGTITTSGGNTIHTYTVTGSNTFVVTSGGFVNTLLVGGGGSGGSVYTNYAGGGGGAGGVTYTESVKIIPGTYPVKVGDGGASVTANTLAGYPGVTGDSSIFLNLVAGGGGGGTARNTTGPSGASSGGGSGTLGPTAITTYNAMSQIGGQDVFIVKYGPSGQILWYTDAGSSGTDNGTSVCRDTTGNVYVTGVYNGLMNLYNSSNTFASNLALINTTQSGFLAKYDQFGIVQGTNRSGSSVITGSSITVSAISISQSNIYVTGYMTGISNWYNSNNAVSSTQNVSTQDVFTAKYSQTGNVYWISKMTSTGADSGVGVATDAAGNVYVNGTYTGPLTIYNSSGSEFSNVLPQVGGSDAFLVKYNTNGNVIWAAYQASTGTDGGSCIGTDPSGNVYTVGYYTGTMNIYSSSNISFSNTFAQINANQCVFLAKYSPNGQVLWGARSGTTTGASTMARLFVESSGNVYVTGSGTNGSYTLYNSNTSSAFQIGGSGASTNGYAFKYDPNGNAKWLMYVTNAGNNNNGQAITGDNLGNIYVSGTLTLAGTSLYSTTFDSITISLAGSLYSGYVLRMNSNGSILNAARVSSGGFTTMTCDLSGFVYILMYATGAATFYDYNGNSIATFAQIGGQDVYILKMNPKNGTAVWTTRAGSSGTDIATYLALDSTNSVIIYGGTYPNATISFYDTSSSQLYSSQTSLGGATNSFLTRFPLV